MVGKAEQLVDSSGETGANPRFVVTSLNPAAWAAQPLYERLYCARGEMENRTKEFQLDLFAEVPQAKPCAPTNCAYGLPRWPMLCWPFGTCQGKRRSIDDPDLHLLARGHAVLVDDAQSNGVVPVG